VLNSRLVSQVLTVTPVAAERIVVQAKHRALLDPQVDRLLCVGDELAAVQLPGDSLRRVQGSFCQVMEQLRAAGRPLVLGFKPSEG
jgi:hypothetical protein